MTKEAILKGIAHNIAHHPGSGLSYISPHLANALRSAGLNTTEIDLLSDSPYPKDVAPNKPLTLSLLQLQLTAEEILTKHKLSFEQISKLMLYVTPAPWDKEGYSLHTRVKIVSNKDRVYDSGWLNELGHT